MKANRTMQVLLKKHGIDLNGAVPDGRTRPILRKLDKSGRLYWISLDGCVLEGSIPKRDLSQIEYEINDVYHEVYSEKDIAGLLRDGIRIMMAWKRDLEKKAPDMHFFIMATFDRGDMLINKEDFPDGCYSLTLRFWAERHGNTVINLEAFDEWDQPALLEKGQWRPETASADSLTGHKTGIHLCHHRRGGCGRDDRFHHRRISAAR